MILQRSLTLRLTCFSAIATVVVISGLSWFINNAIEDYFLKEDRFVLENKIHMIEEVIFRTNFNNDFSEILEKMEKHEGIVIKIKNPKDKIILYISENIRFPTSILTGNGLLAGNPPGNGYSGYFDSKKDALTTNYRTFANASSEQNPLLQWQNKDNLYRGMQFHLTLKSSSPSSILVTLAININHHRNFLLSFKSALIKFTLIAGFISALLGWLVTFQGLRPLKILTKQATLVSMKDIKQRMPVDNLPIEIAGLSQTLNNMLARLETAFQRLENFSSDIAHELRTPINNLMMQTQVALSQPRSKNEYLMTLGSNAEEFDRLASMISDMLFIAKTDNELILISTEEMLLEQEIANLFEFYDALAEDSGITLKSQGQAKVQGDKLMLRRAVSNLLSNAIRHSLKGGEININIYTCKQTVFIDVINYGSTIPPENLAHLFERFYRTDKARQFCPHEGAGLGLAITQSIAKAHGGDLYVSSKDNVTTFTFSIKESK